MFKGVKVAHSLCDVCHCFMPNNGFGLCVKCLDVAENGTKADLDGLIAVGNGRGESLDVRGK